MPSAECEISAFGLIFNTDLYPFEPKSYLGFLVVEYNWLPSVFFTVNTALDVVLYG